MFEENETLVLENTENVDEQATEEIADEKEVEETTEEVETPTEPKKIYTEEEFNKKLDEVLSKKIARTRTKVEKEMEKKYAKLSTVVKAGLGTESIEEATNTLEDYYKEQGVTIPERPSYSQREIEILANAEADEIISSGYEDIVEEVDRLAKIDIKDMTAEEKIIFSKLAKKRTELEDNKSLASIGLKKDDLSEEFNAFAENLNPKLSLKEKYEMYLKFNPKPKGANMGSMKNETTNKVKDFYTDEEISKLTDEELDNPKIWEAVRKSMTGRS